MIHRVLRLVLAAGLFLVAACPQTTFDPPPLGDAGDEAFVRRAVPLLYGRNPASIREVDAMVQLVAQSDRATLIRTMAKSPDYVDRWAEFVMDSLFVNRTGERGNAACYGIRRLDYDDDQLARFLRDNGPRDGSYAETDEDYEGAWSMADLFRSSLWLDDLTPIYRANLFAVMAKDIPLQGVDAAMLVRQNLWGLFEQTYLGRQMACMGCHNSKDAVTDNADPELDRHWPIPGYSEKAVFGDHQGRDVEDMLTLFRKHHVLGGYDIFNQQYDRRPTGCFGDNDPGCGGCACEEAVCAQDPSCCTDTWGPQCVELCQQADLGCVPGAPADFDGCSALYGYPGCADCECQVDVCEAIPTCCELSWTEFCAERCRLWYPEQCEVPGGYNYDLDPGPNAISPWGMHPKCGMFNPPEFAGSDPLDMDSFFIRDFGPDVTIWDVEAPMHAGFDKLRDGPDITGDGDMDGDEALAWLIAAHITDNVWAEVFGNRLTIANKFPRNTWQEQQLDHLSRVFAESGFSLTELLVEITALPEFNPVAPADLSDEPDATPYALHRVFNPWVSGHEVEEMANNSVGDVVHRRNPRYLAISANRALGFPAWPGFPAEPDAGREGRIQEQLGFFLKDSVHGFPGNDFQGLTAWEFAFGACNAQPERNDGCGPRSTPGCDGCACEYAVCVAEPECCEVRWDQRCTGWCGDTRAGCGAAEDAPEPEPMWIPRLAAQLRTPEGASATMGDAVSALKDRLLADPVIDDEEAGLLEALIGERLDTRTDDVGDVEGALRWACSAFLASPQFQFAGVTLPDRLGAEPVIVAPETSFEGFCQELAGQIQEGSISCSGSTLTLN